MKLLGLVGYKQSGKDTALECLRELLPHKQIVRLNFADPLKREVADALNVTVEEIEKNKTAYRTLLQVWGTDVRRNIFGHDYWILKWGNAVNKLNPLPDIVVATDVRFPNEAQLIRDAGGALLSIKRRGHESDGHASEEEIGKIYCDNILFNDFDIPCLKQSMQVILPSLNIT